eukprot:14777063-Alexandrium_andersonii.AAC.1
MPQAEGCPRPFLRTTTCITKPRPRFAQLRLRLLARLRVYPLAVHTPPLMPPETASWRSTFSLER